MRFMLNKPSVSEGYFYNTIDVRRSRKCFIHIAEILGLFLQESKLSIMTMIFGNKTNKYIYYIT